MANIIENISLDGIGNKTENSGATAAGKLSANEFNTIVAALREALSNIHTLAAYNYSSEELNMVIQAAPSNTFIADINNYYVFTTDVTSLLVTLPIVLNTTKIKGCVFFFKTGTVNSVLFNSTNQSPVVFYDGYSVEDNTVYEINCVWNGWAWILSYGIVNGLPAYDSSDSD